MSVSFAVKGSALHVNVDAKNFASLRARLTSLLRDLKVVFDAIQLVNSHGGKKGY